MDHPVIGWEQETAVPDGYAFNDYLSARGGYLYYEELDLARLLMGQEPVQVGRPLASPLEVVYLPKIRQKIAQMRAVFAAVIDETGYPGAFHYAYASKANAAAEVVRTTLEVGAHYEMSSTVDVEIARRMIAAGHLRPDCMVICNGFKPPGIDYTRSLIRLKREHGLVIPVVEDVDELAPLIDSGLSFQVGLRQKSYGPHQDLGEMEAANSRFGMSVDDIHRAAEIIAAAPNLELKLYHAMVGSQILNERDFVAWLTPPIEIYAQLRQRHPGLSIFDFGGGVPVPMTLDFQFDYPAFVRRLLTTLQAACARHNVPAPDVLGEFGRYTTAEHGAHVFDVVAVKENASALPWYLINGSIMTSFPDTWALSEHFIVLPINHLDRPFRRVQLGGITCDSDDVYPPKPSSSPLYLPVESRGLYVGFFGIGAYQEMLGGVRGSKHCVLPEANELVIDRDSQGRYRFEIIPGQSSGDVLRNLGYCDVETKGQGDKETR
ncbi:MAG: arginine decarboxylase [Anaerolineae bacterium]|nr:arginine decarboxylase [Anaerolineae bacterium]